MNKQPEEDLTVDKDMVLLARTVLEFQSLEYIFKDGKWRQVWGDQKMDAVLKVVNKIIEMGEMEVKLRHSDKNKIKEFDDETDINLLIFILREWKNLKETNEYRHVVYRYVLPLKEQTTIQ